MEAFAFGVLPEKEAKAQISRESLEQIVRINIEDNGLALLPATSHGFFICSSV